MRYLITGGAGFIGLHLARRLASETGSLVTVLDNLHRAARPGIRANHFVEGDIRDRQLLDWLMPKHDIVYHLAAQSNVLGAEQDMEYSFTTNVDGTYNVLAAARAAGAVRVIFCSSREVYGEPECLPVPESARLAPKNAYGTSKAAGELYCGAFARQGLPVVVLRLANVIGPGDHDRVVPIFLRRAVRGEPLFLYGGSQQLDFIWIGDVVEALVGAASVDPAVGPVNIGSGTGTSIERLAELMLRLIPSQAGVVKAPGRPAEVAAYVADIRKACQLGLLTPLVNSSHALEGRVQELAAAEAAGIPEAACPAAH